MTLSTRTAIACLVALTCAVFALPQDRKEPKITDEDAKLLRVIERWLERNETERDYVLREVGRGGNGKVDDDFDQWFTRLGGEDAGWDRAFIQRRNTGEIFDRIARHIDLKGAVISRTQFVGYANEFWRKDKSPLWKDPPPFETTQEADRLFKHVDRDNDGYLVAVEMAPALREELKRWDRNQDGWITADEYRYYFVHRLDHVYRELQQKSERPLPALGITLPDDERPQVPRAGNLPPGLPAWFDQLDTDRDGQVALFEWRRVHWPLEEFEKLDSNDDGLLEPAEMLKLLATTDRDGGRPYAYLMKKRIAPAKSSSRK